MEKVPAVFSDYVDKLSAYSVTLVYSDGSEKLLDGEDSNYSLTVSYEDSKDEEQNIHKICHAVVKEVSTGKEFEDTQEIILGRAAPDEISTEAMTTLILQGKKKWLIVQSTPSVSGSYALNSDRTINNIWYKSENGEIICTEDYRPGFLPEYFFVCLVFLSWNAYGHLAGGLVDLGGNLLKL